MGRAGEGGARLIEHLAQGVVDGLALGDGVLAPATGEERDLAEGELTGFVGGEGRPQRAVAFHHRPPRGREVVAVDVAGQLQGQRHPRAGSRPR